MILAQNRTYRKIISKNNLVAFDVAVKETDIFVQATKPLKDVTKELILKYRGYIEAYIEKFPKFAQTLHPWHINEPAPAIIQSMAKAGSIAGVGPMATVAGAIAENVGVDLLSYTNEVIVENGGDIFLKTDIPVTIGIFAGKSPLNMRIGLRVNSAKRPMAVCTSSGTIGHSLSMGKADAVCVVSESCSLADAAATAIGNHVKSKIDIKEAADFGKNIQGISGFIIVVEDKICAWGDVELVPL